VARLEAQAPPDAVRVADELRVAGIGPDLVAAVATLTDDARPMVVIVLADATEHVTRHLSQWLGQSAGAGGGGPPDPAQSTDRAACQPSRSRWAGPRRYGEPGPAMKTPPGREQEHEPERDWRIHNAKPAAQTTQKEA